MSLQVLLFEPDKSIAGMFESIIHQVAPSATLHQATSSYEAQRIAGSAKPDVLVLDLESGKEALDLMIDFKTYHPMARMLLLVPEVLPEGFEHAIRSGAVHFLPKPFSPQQALKMLSWLLNPGSVTADSFYQAHLHHVSLLDILQMKVQGGFTTLLDISSSTGPRGRIILDQGKIAHAVVGSLQGEAAFEEILSWKGGAITEQPAPVPVLHSITKDSQELLLEAARILDHKVQDENLIEIDPNTIDEVAAASNRVVSVGGIDEEELSRFMSLPKMLIIDDNPMILHCAEEMLAHAWPSHAIIGVESGSEGFECAQLYRPQAILLDFALPDFNGDAFAAKLREHEDLARIPIILMSGFVNEIKTAALHHPNVIGTLAKPFVMNELIHLVKMALELPPPPLHPEVERSLRFNNGMTTRILRQQKPRSMTLLPRSTVRLGNKEG
jgi:CheY-like chemotaxis protein